MDTDRPFIYLPGWASNSPDSSMHVTTVSEILSIILNIALGTAIAVSMIMTIVSGIKFITAKGDPKAAATAKTSLTNAIIATVLTLGAYTIKLIIFNVIGGDYGDLRNATPNF